MKKERKSCENPVGGRGNDIYLCANQKSERLVPVPDHHVPYLSRSHYCNTADQVDLHFHLTGLGTGRSPHHYLPYNLNCTLEI